MSNYDYMTKHEIAERIMLNISNKFDVPKSEVSLNSTFKSVGVDSLDGVEIIVDVENEFKINVPDNRLLILQSVGLLVDYIDNSINKKNRKRSIKKF
jgi:acyl carrier protein